MFHHFLIYYDFSRVTIETWKQLLKQQVTLVQVYCACTICSHTLEAFISSRLKLISVFNMNIAIIMSTSGYKQFRIQLCLALQTQASLSLGVISKCVVNPSENLANWLYRRTQNLSVYDLVCLHIQASMRDLILLYYLYITFPEIQEWQHCNSGQGWWCSLQRTKTASSKYLLGLTSEKNGRK